MIALGAMAGLHIAMTLLAGEHPVSSTPHARVPVALREELAAKAAMNANEGRGRYTATTATVLVCLIDRIPRGGALKMSQAGLADLVGVSRRTLQRHTAILEGGGYICVERSRVARDRMATHVYRLSARVESMVYASGEPGTMRQFGAGNNIVVVKDSSVDTTTESGAKSAHSDPVAAIIAEGYDETRVRQLWQYAEKHGRIANIPGWVRSALAGDWHVPGADEIKILTAEEQAYYDDLYAEAAGLKERLEPPPFEQERVVFEPAGPDVSAEDRSLWDYALDQMQHQIDKSTWYLIGQRFRLERVEGATFYAVVDDEFRLTYCRYMTRNIQRILEMVWGLRRGEARLEWRLEDGHRPEGQGGGSGGGSAAQAGGAAVTPDAYGVGAY